MKSIENLAMEEDLSTSPSAAMPESPPKTEDEDDSMEAGDDQVLTTDSLEDALNLQLAELEKEEAKEKKDSGSDPCSAATADDDVVEDEDGVENVEDDCVEVTGQAKDAPKPDTSDGAVTEDENVTDEDEEDVDKATLSDAEKLLEDDDDKASDVADDENSSLSDAEKLLDDDETSQSEAASKDSVKNEAGPETKEADLEPVKSPEEAATGKSLAEADADPAPDATASEAKEAETEMDQAEPEVKQPKTPLDLEEGLNDLSRILQSFKNLDEDPADKEKVGKKCDFSLPFAPPLDWLQSHSSFHYKAALFLEEKCLVSLMVNFIRMKNTLGCCSCRLIVALLILDVGSSDSCCNILSCTATSN